jgi:transposase
MRYELGDCEWSVIRPMLPNKPRGIPRVDDRRILNGIFWVLRSGAPWRDLPDSYGPYTTCYNRFVRWRRAGIWDQIMDALAVAHDAAVQMIATSIVRVHQHGACITNERGPAYGSLSWRAYQQDPCRCGWQRFAGATRPHRWSGARQQALLGLAEISTSARAVAGRSRLRRGLDRGICHRTGRVGEHTTQAQSQGPDLLQPLSLPRPQPGGAVFFNKIKQRRRVATRYDKLAANYLAFVKLACIRLWLRVYECTA